MTSIVSKEQLLMVLPSNSSMRYFPENTTTSFTTQLPQQVHLRGQWEVALTEIQFPCSFFNIRPDEGWLVFHLVHSNHNSIDGLPQFMARVMNETDIEKRKEVRSGNISISPGVYNLSELLEALNRKSKSLNTHIVWSYVPHSGGKISMSLSCKKEACSFTHYVKFSNKLRRMLGYDVHKEREELVIPDIENPTVSLRLAESNLTPDPHEDDLKLFYKVPQWGVMSDEPANMTRGVPDKLFVYCDICEPYVTGDVVTPLLRVVPVEYASSKYNYGSYGVKHFSPLNYIPLRITSFRTIEIDIRDQMGEKIPFEFRTLTVTLQFKRCD